MEIDKVTNLYPFSNFKKKERKKEKNIYLFLFFFVPSLLKNDLFFFLHYFADK